jgi:hypothetical protein
MRLHAGPERIVVVVAHQREASISRWQRSARHEASLYWRAILQRPANRLTFQAYERLPLRGIRHTCLSGTDWHASSVNTTRDYGEPWEPLSLIVLL